MGYEVPPLPYAYDALEPAIDGQTMRLHHDKHHQAYVDRLNATVTGTEYEDRPIDDLIEGLRKLPDGIRETVRNHGGGHLNHTMFWESITPGAGTEPTGELAYAITVTYKTLETLKAEFETAAMSRFGSGWVWLVLQGQSLKIVTTANQDNPLSERQSPLLGNDLWEHAYYLQYQNRRLEYLQAWWKIVDWNTVASRYSSAMR
jgi:Fe-Mn family superoxide dismutase